PMQYRDPEIRLEGTPLRRLVAPPAALAVLCEYAINCPVTSCQPFGVSCASTKPPDFAAFSTSFALLDVAGARFTVSKKSGGTRPETKLLTTLPKSALLYLTVASKDKPSLEPESAKHPASWAWPATAPFPESRD